MTIDGIHEIAVTVKRWQDEGRPGWGREEPVKSIVYFVQVGDDGPVKIGFTTNMPHRLATIQTGQPQKVRLRAFAYGGRDMEAQFHATFDDLRLRGEWFKFEGELRATLEELARRDA